MNCDRCSYLGEPCPRCLRTIAAREDARTETDEYATRAAERRYERSIYGE